MQDTKQDLKEIYQTVGRSDLCTAGANIIFAFCCVCIFPVAHKGHVFVFRKKSILFDSLKKINDFHIFLVGIQYGAFPTKGNFVVFIKVANAFAL